MFEAFHLDRIFQFCGDTSQKTSSRVVRCGHFGSMGGRRRTQRSARARSKREWRVARSSNFPRFFLFLPRVTSIPFSKLSSTLAAGCPTIGLAGQLALAFQDSPSELRQFWQARFYDFSVFTEKKKKENWNMCMGTQSCAASIPRTGRWSSWSNYANNGKGMIAVDLI